MNKPVLSILSSLIFITASSQCHASDITIVASNSQISEMQNTINELNAENININHIDVKDLKSAINSKFMIICMSSKDSSVDILKEKLPASAVNSLEKPGKGKFVVLRSPWEENQEVVAFVGNSEKEVSEVRRKTWATWWTTVAEWFDINTMVVPNY